MKILFFYRNNASLGIEYLSSVLKQAGHQTELLLDPSMDNIGLGFLSRFNGFTKKMIINKIESFKPDLIAFSVFTNSFTWASNLAYTIKTEFEIPILMGGPHPTILPNYVIKKKHIDFLIIGEGEKAMITLLDALEGKIPFNQVPNLWYKEEKTNKILSNKIIDLIEDLDTIPFPDKDLFSKYGEFNRRYHIITSRGCNYDCTYCINHQYHEIYPNQPRLRRRSVQNVIEELIWAKQKYKIKSLYFIDDNFLYEEKWLVNFAKEYLRHKIGIPFKCLAHPMSITEKKIKILKKIGCVEIDIAIESGSPKIRKLVYNRHMNNSNIIKNARIIKKYKINLTTLNIINSPLETPKDMIQTIKINRIIKPNGFQITSLYPYPKTKIFFRCIEEGILPQNIISQAYRGKSNYRSRSILNHPYLEIGERIRLFTPTFIKLPKKFHNLIFIFPSLNIFNVLNIISSTSLKNSIRLLIEYYYMFHNSRKTYLREHN